MEISANAVAVQEILTLREKYRQEMNCQIIHDSLHSRKGWTQSFLLACDGAPAGYGALAIGGPWKGKPTLFEFHVSPPYRSRVFDLFSALLSASGAISIETQSNDPQLTVMIHAFAQNVASESILFHDKLRTGHCPLGAQFRAAAPDDASQMGQRELDPDAKWVVEIEGTIAAAGDILFHYNRPYGDIYMKVAEPFRRRGVGSYLVQELKLVCYEGGSVPAARCNVTNVPSRKTLQKAGFVPCGHILTGSVLRSS